MRKGIVSLLTILGVLFFASLALAAEGDASAADLWSKGLVVGLSVFGAAFSMGVAALGVGPAMGYATSGASSAVGRNPDAQGKVMLTMLVGMAMTESIAIYALVISLILIYANPMLAMMGLG